MNGFVGLVLRISPVGSGGWVYSIDWCEGGMRDEVSCCDGM